MGLFGSKPKLQPAGAAERRLSTEADRLAGEAGGFTDSVNRLGDSLRRGMRGARSDAIGATSADAAQSFRGVPTTRQGALGNALNKARGLSRLAQATGSEFDERLLRGRIGFATAQRQRQGRGLAALSGAAGVEAGTNAAVQARHAAQADARANVFGTVAGIGAGFLHQPGIRSRIGNAFRSSIPTPVTGSLGTNFNPAATSNLA